MGKYKWSFRATVLKVIDGDTIKFRVDQGFNNYREENLRLARINAPEKRVGETEGYAARDWLLHQLALVGNKVRIETVKHGKYRWVCECFIEVENSSNEKVELNISDALVGNGHAVYKEY